MVEPSQEMIPLARQCELLGLARSTYYYRPQGVSEKDLACMRLMDETFTNLDVEGLVQAITDAANDIGALASGKETRAALNDIPGTLAEVRSTLRTIQALAASADTTMETIRPGIDASSRDIEAAAEELDAMLANLRAVVEPGSPLLTNLETSLYEISIAAAALGELADYLQQNPSALLRGKDVEGN